MEKKNSIIIGVIVVVIIAAAAIIFLKKDNIKPEEILENETAIETETQFNEAIISDTTTSINDSLDNIDVTDTSVEDLNAVDQELQNL